MLLAMVTKSMDIHVLPKLANATIVFISFDLWMSRGCIDILILVINYLSKNWEPMHAIVDLFEVNETTNLCMA